MKQTFFKLLSIVLTLSLVFTCCMVAFNATAEETKKTVTYYISTNTVAGNDGLSSAKPLGSVNAVIAAVGDTCGEGDTVYIKVAADKDTSDKVIPVPWDENGNNVIADHDYLLHISSASGSSAIIGDGTAVSFSGDITFSNIKINNPVSGTNFSLGNGNIRFEKNAAWNSSNKPQFVTSLGAAPTKDFNLYFGIKTISSLVFGGVYNNLKFGATEADKVTATVTVDSGAAADFTFGDRGYSQNGGDHSTTYNYATFNFDLKTASSFSFSNYGKPYFTSNAAVQIIDSTGNATITDAAKAYLAAKTTNDETPAPLKYFIIRNPYSFEKDLIQFTDTVGKFKVNEDPSICEFVNKDYESIKVTPDADGYVTFITPGEYVLTVYKEANTTNTYYLSPNGSNAYTGIESAPFRTLDALIDAAKKAGYKAGDTVYVKVFYVEGKSAPITI